MPAALTTLPIQKRVARTRETTNQGAERARESGEKVLLNPRVTHAATAADEQMATQIWIFRTCMQLFFLRKMDGFFPPSPKRSSRSTYS